MSWRRVARVPGDPSHPLPVSGDPLAVSDDVLASALDDLDAGFTPVEILDRYPEYASELAPLLQTAYELRMTRWPVMSVGGRVAGRERMHAALSAQKRRKAGFLPPFWRQVGVTAALMVMAGAVFLASPLSPLDFPRRGRAVTPTMSAPAVAAPTSTLTAVAPTTSPTVTQPATEMPARVPAVITDEPSETPERLVLAEERASATPTPAPTATPMRRATRTRTATPAPTATVSATAVTATPTAQSGGSSATAQPSPSPTRVIVISTPAPTHTPPAKPSPTVTVRPTEPPEPTATLTLPPPTRTPQPSLTPAPTASRTPEPTETSELPEATRTPKHTPRPSATPGPSRTPRVGAALPGAPQIRSALEGRPVQTMQQEMRTVIRAIRSPVPRAGRP